MKKWLFWFFAISLALLAGRLSSEFFKWLMVMLSAPTAEARDIMVGYVITSLIPVLLAAVPAALCWVWLFGSRYRREAATFLVLELAFIAYVVYGEVQRGVAVLLQQ